MPAYPKNATLIYRHDINDELAIMRVASDEGPIPDFAPGQYAELALPTPEQENPPEGQRPPKLLRRSYSIGSPPSMRDYLEFYIVLVPDGALTPSLWGLKQNDKLWLGPKIKGKFTLDGLPTDKDFIMVATGTGLAPFTSMLHEFRQQNKWRRFVLVHGVRYSRDLGYREELEKLAKVDSNFIYVPMTTREPETSDWSGLRGRVTTLFESNAVFQEKVGIPLTPEDSHVFLCGNPAMIDSVQQQLESQGFNPHTKKTPGNLHFERYW